MNAIRASIWTLNVASILLGALLLGVCLPFPAQTASTSGQASVQVMAHPSMIGTLSIFTVNVANPQQSSKRINASPQLVNNSSFMQSTPNGDAQIQPAVFAISGLTSQTFAIVVPSPGVYATSKGNVQFYNFTHNAGSTPVIGSSGSSVFAVGARLQFIPNSELDFGTAAGPATPQDASSADAMPDSPSTSSAPKGAILPTPRPFGMLGIEDGFMSVLISYN